MPLALLFATSLLACGGQKAAPAAAADAAPPAAKSGLTGDFPSDSASQAFAEALIEITIENFAAVDSGGAEVVLSTLRFAGDNSWSASGYVDAGEERMECTEKGHWSMDTADSKTQASINWTIDSTDCIGREAGNETRAQVTIKGSDVEIAFR